MPRCKRRWNASETLRNRGSVWTKLNAPACGKNGTLPNGIGCAFANAGLLRRASDGLLPSSEGFVNLASCFLERPGTIDLVIGQPALFFHRHLRRDAPFSL